MTDDELSALLDEGPARSPTHFRGDVLVRIAERASRRAAQRKALLQVAGFTAAGAVVALVQVSGMDLAPVGLTVGALSVAFMAAFVSIQGPKGAVRALAAVRF